MKRLTVSPSTEYDVIVGSGLLDDCGKYISEVCPPCRAFVISDDNVFPLYGERVRRSLESAGYEMSEFIFPHGEQSKNLVFYSAVLEQMCLSHITRGDIAVALGGGVVGDLAGFAAATYQRGIKFVQIPTTLLAAVDSSVGGKTGVDLEHGKNQVGAFHQPSLVICDMDTFGTLPDEEYRCGCAEVIKYAMIGSERFFRELEADPADEQFEHVILTCVAMKSEYVAEDEFDLGSRMMLNFGHTAGHAIEKCSGYGIPHGRAVAMGMAAVTAGAEALDRCPAGTAAQLVSLLERYGLESKAPFSADELAEASLADKKMNGDKLRLIIPERIGKCVIEEMSVEDFRDLLIAGGRTE